MIGKISGRLDYVAEDHALIEAAGVGYVIHCSARTLAGLPQPGEHAALYTEMVVREDLHQLFGFPTLAEKEWHRLLTSVPGVGAKAALAVLGALGPDALARAIAVGDAAAIRRAPGIGPKIAARLASELKDKAPTIMAMGARMARPAGGVSAMPEVLDDDPAPAAKPRRTRAPAAPDPAALRAAASAAAQADALSALTNLGYGMSEAAQAIAEAAAPADDEAAAPDASALIRAALRALAPRG
ncbi:MAG: Holliday junction DNA helicase RuvA [Paracoccaceae bacterium]|jgi:Holliday junction DNA helicase RuvA